MIRFINDSIQSTLFKHGKWLSKLVFWHAVQQLQAINIKTSD